MDMTFYGATESVTGSCHILRCNGHTVLLDCGLIQGSRKADALNRDPFPFDAAAVDAVVLSHGHIDHSGRLPLLHKRGFRGTIHTQNASADLIEILLKDSARLQEYDADRYNRKRRKDGEPPREPLYRPADVDTLLDRVVGHRYGERFEVLPGISARLLDAGHILGSAIVELQLNENGVSRTLVFSGDIGQHDTPIINDPTLVAHADAIIMESTYGNRHHRDREDTIRELGDIVAAAHRDGGNILIPAFAIGRSQELLYHLGTHYDAWGLSSWQVFLDSPMAIEASKVYWDYPQLYDDETTRLRKGIHDMPRLQNLHFSRSVEDSKSIAGYTRGAIVIAGSGMCTGGRILHHLKNNLGNPRTHVVICGYQSPGTLGGRLVNGEDQVKIHGRWIDNRATVHTVGGLSAHGDQADLMRWLRGFRSTPPVYVVHGNDRAKQGLVDHLNDVHGWPAEVAREAQTVDLSGL
ncbi:MAG: MBL fold metallo-hydrolase [Pseudomonadota bacterium]